MAMGKKDFVERAAKEAGISKASAEKAFNSIFDGIKSALKKGEKVTFVGFGSFSVSQREARKGRNPQTGKDIKIPARKVPKFAAGASLKEAVNGKKKK